MSIKQTKNVHPIIKFLKNEKDLFLFDTETTGFGSKETPPGLLEFYGIKFKLKKDLNIELKETEKTFQINFNGYKYNGKYTSVERDSNGDISKIISNKENIVIKSNIPFIKDTYDEKSKEKLLFNTVGSLEEVGEIDELFKTDIPSAIDAIVVHKIIDKKSFNKKEQLDLMKRYLEKYKNKELPEKVEELEKKIKIMGVITTGEKTFEKKMKEKIEGTDKVAVATRYENQLKEGKEYYKAYKREKVFAEFLEEFGFRDNSTAPELNDEKREEITKALTENIYAGHNVFSFDMKQVIERNGIEKIDNPDIIDTMYLPIEYKDEDKFLSMDKYITKFLTKELSLIQKGFNNILKNIEKDLFPIVKDYEKKLLKNEDTISEKIKDFNKEISLLKTPAEKDEKKKEKYDYINTLLVKENQEFAKKYEKYLSFKDTFNEKWFSDLEGNNIQIDKMKVKDINEIEDIRNFDEIKILLKDLGYENEIANFEYLNSVLIKKRERKVIHTAKLDIELNSFVLERQLKNYVNKFGLEDVLTKSHEKEVINVIDSKEETKSDLIKNLKGMLGIKTSYSKNTLGSNDQIIERMDEIGIDQISLSNDNFGNAFNDYKEFKSEEKTNLASFEVKIEETGEVVSLVWTDKDSYVNAILLIKDYKIKRADLDILLEETNTKVMIPPHLDNEFENDNVFIKVEPYSKEDYTQDFKNKRILWINNKAVFNTENIKPLQFIWEGIKYNEKNTPMEDHKRINFSTNYQNIHIPSKSELEEIFPVEQYADIYENTNNIFEGAEMFRPYKDNVELLPDIDRLVEGLTDVPETPEEYKNVMLKELREAWDSHQMMDIVKKTAIELYVKKTKEYYQNLKSSDLKSLSSEDKEKANRFINEIDLGDLSRNKKEFFRFIDKEINENPEFKDFVKEIKTVYTDRILYEVESLTGFENYKTVFNYYFQMRKILNDLSEKGVGHGPGRGSAAGSIIAYMFKITDMDPVRYELLFERFMNPERVSMPDIDIDLPLDEFITKDHVIKILTDSFQLSENDLKSLLVMEYGYNEKIVDKMIERDYTKYVGKVATTIKSSEKTVLTNYARLRGVPLMALRNIQREYDTELSLEENIENINELGGLYYNIESLKDELHMLADLPTSTGAHAGAVMIPGLPENVTCPMLEGTSVFDKDIPEHESKWDLLGLKGMVLYFLLKAKKEVSQKTGKVEEIDFNFNVLEDTNVMKLIQDGFNANVFQIESDGMRKMLKSLSPLDFDTLITALALYRPGPMGAGAVDAFITNKYLDLQGKYMKYMTRPVKVGEITNVDSDKAYDRIKDPKFKKLVDKKLFNKIMNTTSYFDSDLFKENTKGFLTEIVQRVTDGEHIEPNEEGLTTLEKKFLLYYESTKSISKAVDKAVGKAIEYENRILDSESYKEITKETSGTIVYQEQIMQMATKIAGFTKGQSDVLRKAVAKQNFKLLNSLKEDLINGFYNKIDTIKSKDLTIKRNDEFELVLNTKKFDNVNLYNTKIIFSELDGIDFEVATSKDKQYKILKSMGGDVTKIEEIKTNLKNIREEMKVLKYKSKAGEEVDVERFNELKVLKQSTIKELNVEEDTLEDRVKKTLTSEIKDSYTIEEDNIERLKTFDKTTAEYLFDKIVKFGEYAFNKSHSARYALLTYSSAFYKYYYPEKFYALALKQSSLDSAQEIFKEINSTDINVELMKLNDMNKDFDYDLEKHSISFSPLKMKSVSKNGIIALYEGLKKDGKYTSLLDARTRIPKKLLNKRTVLQLGKSGFFNDQIAPLTEKLFEEKFEEINDVLEDVLKINQTNFVKEVSSNTDYSNRDVKSYISLRAKLDKNIVIDIQLEEYAQQMSNIKNMFIEGNISEEDHAKDLEELKKSISSLYEEKNKEKIEESDLEFIFDFEKENKTYINKHLKKEHSNEELYGLVLEKIESKLGKEEVENFKNRVENGENYTEEEQNKVYMSVFAEYNFRKTAINLNGKEIEKDKLEIWMNEYYDNIYHGVNSSKGLSTTFRDDGIEPIDNEEKPNIFIGKNPKVVFMVDFLQDSNIIKSLSIGDEELRGEEKSFENNQGKVIKYFRYYDKENNEYKLEGVKTNTGYKKVLKRKVNKEWVEVKAEHKISFITKPETYLKEKVLPYVSNDLTIDDFAVMAYYPFKNKKEIPQKVLKSTIYFDAIKKRFKEKDFEIPLMLIGGTEPIKKTKDLHNMKLKTQYYYPETFNFKNKEQSKGKTYKELQKHMMSVIYVENAWHGFAANKQMEENLQNIITKTIKGINYVENKSVQLGKTQRNSLEEDNTTKMS